MFTRQNTLGWARGDRITAAQINGLDVNLANAIDGAGGGTYTLSDPLVLTGDSVQIGNELFVQSTATATFEGSAQFTAGAGLSIDTGSNIFFAAGSDLTLAGGATGTIGGDVTYGTGSSLTMASGSTATLTGTVTAVDLTVLAGYHYKLGSRTLTRVQRGFMWDSTGHYVNTATAVVNDSVYSELDLPQGSTILTCTARVEPGHAPPGNPLEIHVVRVTLSTGATSTIASKIDAQSAPEIAAYSSAHDLTASSWTAGTDAIDNTQYRYYAKVKAETAIGGGANCSVYGFKVTYTATTVDDGH